MIFREKNEKESILIRQHDHGFLAGEIASNIKEDFFGNQEYLMETIDAIYEHDRGWIGLDKVPILNDAKNIPYTFMDCPSSLRFVFYTIGLNEIEDFNPYGALLCSKHFLSFPLNEEDEEMLSFYKHELERQKRILKTLTKKQYSMFDKHYRLLKFCDELSLYVCMNKPGVKKKDEIDLFKNGFEGTEMFNSKEDKIIQAEWVDGETIRIKPFLFKIEFHTYVKYKALNKREIEEKGIAKADKESEIKKQKIRFIK
ncbi:serine hydroxymethyltransferase [Bacillus cereus]|nr:serine hydroxymethyltransferase [Bacillus cereus]PGU66743.1 serine hydroxymethyltransferase [Bacillus cereus]